jgi:hypothetical protein
MDAPASFEFAKETTTQLIALATGVIGISVTFAKDVRSRLKTNDGTLLFRSWIALLVSVVFGVWTLLALTGSLAQDNVAADAIYGGNVTLPSILQIFTFLIGIAMLIRHASK